MSGVQNIPAAAGKDSRGPDAPTVTLLGTDLPDAYLDDAEPSPLVESAARLWARLKRLLALFAVILAVGFYPAAILSGHQIDAREVTSSDRLNWHSAETGTLLTLLGRELTGPGWVRDRPSWHPQARLTALPAWQAATTQSLSTYSALVATLSQDRDGQPDQDLAAASRLFATDPAAQAVPSLNAAAEALQRYDGRLARDLAVRAESLSDLDAKLTEFIEWGSRSHADLRRQATSTGRWPAERADIEAIYAARARAHVAGELLSAALSASAERLSLAAAAEGNTALAAWRKAAAFNPILITSQPGTGRLVADHPAIMAFYIAEATAATEILQSVVRAERNVSVTVAK